MLDIVESTESPRKGDVLLLINREREDWEGEAVFLPRRSIDPLRNLSDEELVLSYRDEPSLDKEEELFRRFSRLIFKIVHKYNYRDKEELYQIGWIGLIKAIKRFEPSRNVKFTSYAYRLIDGEIKHFLRDKSELIRRPAWIKELINKMMRLLEREENLTLEELADKLNITEEGLREVIKAVIKVDYEPDISKIRSKRYQSFQLPIEDKIFLSQILSKLSEVEQKVIYYVFEMDLTQTEIGKILNVSQRTVSRILERALRKLRKISHREVSEDIRWKDEDKG